MKGLGMVLAIMKPHHTGRDEVVSVDLHGWQVQA